MKDNLFVVLQDTKDGGRETMYPEVHYVYADDNFSSAMDVVEQRPGDISLLVDLDESGRRVLACQSLSSGWQPLEASIQTQNLDKGQQGQLLSITGTSSRVPTDIPDLDGNFDAQIARADALVADLEARNAEISRILG